MPYCSSCGAEVAATSRYCQKCGAPQPVAPEGTEGFLQTVSARNASLLCYIPLLGWIAAIVVLASSTFRRNRYVRFHAFQGLYLFVAWLLVQWVVSPVLKVAGRPLRDMPFSPLFVGNVLEIVLIAAWVVMLVKASREEYYRLPVVGELAERSVAEL